MDPGSIVAICIAGIGALGTVVTTILTVNYVSSLTSFGDKQNTGITLTDETFYPNGAGLAGRKTISFSADDYDRYAAQSIKFKNGEQEVKATNLKKPINIDAVADGKGQTSVASEATYLGKSAAVSPRIFIERSIDDKNNIGLKHEIIEVSDLQAILDNDVKGEKEASIMRQSNFYKAVQAHMESVKNDFELVKFYISHTYDASFAGDINDIA